MRLKNAINTSRSPFAKASIPFPVHEMEEATTSCVEAILHSCTFSQVLDS